MIYGVRGLAAWVTIGIIWVFTAIVLVVFMPLYESRESLMQIIRGIIKVAQLSFDSRPITHRSLCLFLFDRISSRPEVASLSTIQGGKRSKEWHDVIVRKDTVVLSLL